MADEHAHRQPPERGDDLHHRHDREGDADGGHGHHGHHHGPERGWRAGLRYLQMVPRFWSSEVNDAVVALVDPQPGERVLDIGAGMGAATVRAAVAVGDGHVVAVDPLPVMRTILGMRRWWPGRTGRITVLEGSAEELPVADASIDAAWATNALHHFDDLEGAARELARVVRPGGRATFVEEQFTDPAHPSYERFTRDDSGHRFHAVDLDRVRSVFDAAGFDVTTAADRTVAGVPAKLVELRRRG